MLESKIWIREADPLSSNAAPIPRPSGCFHVARSSTRTKDSACRLLHVTAQCGVSARAWITHDTSGLAPVGCRPLSAEGIGLMKRFHCVKWHTYSLYAGRGGAEKRTVAGRVALKGKCRLKLPRRRLKGSRSAVQCELSACRQAVFS